MQLDLLPPDLAGQVQRAAAVRLHGRRGAPAVRGADGASCASSSLQSYFNQMSEGMQNMSPEQHAAHEGHARRAQPDARAARARARSPTSTGSWSATATSSPGTRRPSTSCSSRWRSAMAAMQQMLNSMTPEQRAQLQGLAEPLLEDMDLRWQMDQLGAATCSSAFPQMGWDQQLRLPRRRPAAASAEAGAARRSSATSTQLENLLRSATQPGPAGRGRPRPGPRPARRRRRPLARAAGRAGQDARGGRPHRAARRPHTSSRPRASAASASSALGDLFQQAAAGPRRPPRDRARRRRPRARLRAPSPTSSATRSTSTSSARSATRSARQGGGTPVRLTPDDFEIERTEHADAVARPC